jgi:kinesin family member 3A
LIVGGVNLGDKAKEQARLLEESERELEQRIKSEEQLRKEIELKEVRTSCERVHYSCVLRILGRNIGYEREVCFTQR